MSAGKSTIIWAAASLAVVLAAFLLLHLFPNQLQVHHKQEEQKDVNSEGKEKIISGHKSINRQNDDSSQVPILSREEDGESFLRKIRKIDLSSIVPLTAAPLSISEVDSFNNVRITPRLQSIVEMDYFRFVKLNLSKKCSLWPDDARCPERDCHIAVCSEPPEALLDEDYVESGESDCSDGSSNLSEINATISSEHEETMDSLFECSNDEDGQYIDLLLNPERYTGYRGESAHRVWKSIYEENCFFKHQKNVNPFSLDSLCYEERLFYRAISGLHTSINVHLCARYPVNRHSDHFTHNVNEFLKRFAGKENYITNLYFLYLLELRALAKIAPYLIKKVNWKSSGDSALTRDAIRDLLQSVRSLKSHFDESNLFRNEEPSIAREFAQHFSNITNNIMDCVACQKCKLWGKIQIHGLGTAFKILIKESDQKELHNIHLTRHEITSLVNAIAKLAKSIQFLEEFDKLLSVDSVQIKKDLRTHLPFS